MIAALLLQKWKEEILKLLENYDLPNIDNVSDDGKWADHESDDFVNVIYGFVDLVDNSENDGDSKSDKESNER